MRQALNRCCILAAVPDTSSVALTVRSRPQENLEPQENMPRKQSQPGTGRAMFSSVRFRLTFYYTAAFAIVLLVLALGVYAILKQENVKRIDAEISQLADSFLTTVHAELKDQPEHDAVKLSTDEAIIKSYFRDNDFAVFCFDRTLVESSPTNFPTRDNNDFSFSALFHSRSFQQLLAGS